MEALQSRVYESYIHQPTKSELQQFNGLITDYSKRVSDFFYSGEPIIREWFLLGSDFLPLVLSLTYVIGIYIGMRLMQNRQPFDLRKPMIVFNFSLVAAYVVCVSLVFIYLPSVPWDLFCKGGVFRENDTAYFLLRVGWIAYLMKYIEFFDTVFFVLRKKNHLVTFLHVFHHAVVPLLGWISFRTERSALQAIPALLNCLIHIVMYTYYGLAAVGPKFRKYLWWKKYLTQMQIVQFIFVIFFVAVIAPLTGCPMVMSSYIMDIIFGPLFLVLFYRFYKTTFKRKSE